MPLIPEPLVDRVKREISIVLLITRVGIELRRVGQNLVGRCNRHVDETASLMVSEEKNLFHDMGACQRGGSVIDWVMWQEDLGFHEATRKLIEEFFPAEARQLFSQPLSRPSRRFRAEELACPIDEEAEGQELDRQVVAYYHETGKQSPELHAYLQKRGLDDAELVERFQLGLANRTLGMRLSGRLRRRCQARGWLREKTGHEHLNGSMVLAIPGASGEIVNCYGRKIRDDLNARSVPHLYLPRPLHGVLNREAFQASGEILLCEAPIDFLSAWRHGFRHSTCTWGAENFTDDHLDAFVTHGIERCLIAFDRDEAGDRGAAGVARKLAPAGVACYRVLFPKGMDLNDVVVKMQPPEKTLALFFRSAEWMCGGNGAKSVVLGASGASPASVSDARHEHSSGNGKNGERLPLSAAHLLVIPLSSKTGESEQAARAATEAASEPGNAAPGPGGATEGESSPDAAEKGILSGSPVLSARPGPTETAPAAAATDRFAQARPAPGPSPRATGPLEPASQAAPEPPASSGASLPPSASPDPLVSSTDDEAVFLFGDRRYRVRGLKRNTAFGILKLNVLVTREGISFAGTPLSGLHADTFDIYLARARQLFERQAAQETGVKDDVVKRDLCAMLRRLEEIQAEAVRKAHEPKVKAVLITEKETAEALGFWKSPDLLSRIVSDMTACGLVGEPTNKLITYIAGVSRLLDRPLAVIIQSSSAAGKTALMEAILSLMPEECREKYTAVSGKSLFYFDETTSLRHKILAIVEEEGAERATYPLKLLQSEGELVMASTGKDPHTGKLVTQIYKVEGPVMIILTTTAIELDPELENRCLRLTVDESREQTRLIHELQRQRQTLEGLFANKGKQRIQKLHQNAQRLLRPVKVLNPYVKELTFVDDQTRTRRDHDKYLTLIETIALMHQHQRPIQHVTIEDEVVECVKVELSDIEVANRLAGEVLGRTLDELPPQTRRFLELLYARVKAICDEQEVEQCDLRFTRRHIREWTGYRATQVFIHMARLEELEYVLRHRGGRGQSFVYELLYRGEGVDGRPFVLGLVDIETLRRKDQAPSNAAPTPAAGEPAPAPASYDPNLSDFSGEVSGSNRGQIGGVSAGSRAPESGLPPAQDAPLSAVGAVSHENALIPDVPKNRSYPARSCRLKPLRPGIKLNLLRFPPSSLERPAPRGAELQPGA